MIIFKKEIEKLNYHHIDEEKGKTYYSTPIAYYGGGLNLSKLNIDNYGLNDTDHKYLKTIIEKFKGGPVGLNTIAATIGEEVNTLEDVYEPYLLQEGFIVRSPRGRLVTDKAYNHLGYEKHGS